MKPLNFSRAQLIFLLAMPLSVASGIAFGAVQGDELRGEVVEVDSQANTITVRPLEVGEELTIPTGSDQTFDVDENTIIRDDVYATQLDDLDNIEENDIVRLAFDTDANGRMRARNVNREGGDNQQVAQADNQRADELPATASFFPLFALGGFSLWAIALVLRVARKRE